MRRRTEHGFSLLEVAVAIGVVAILAAAAAPLVLKALNQQREERTRRDLKTAFEALVGSRERRVPNLRADFGFIPANASNLGVLINPPLARSFGPDATYGGMAWGWNGPYWSGSVGAVGGATVPVDGWGRPIRLVVVGGTWQVQSAGANGTFGTGSNDDLAYPVAPVPAGTQATTLTINVQNLRGVPVPVTLQVSDRNNLAARLSVVQVSGPGPAVTLGASPGSAVWTFQPTPGQVRVLLGWDAASSAHEVIDLLPGESRTLSYKIY